MASRPWPDPGIGGLRVSSQCARLLFDARSLHPFPLQTVFLETFQRSIKDDLTVLPLRGMEAERLQPWRAFQQAHNIIETI